MNTGTAGVRWGISHCAHSTNQYICQIPVMTSVEHARTHTKHRAHNTQHITHDPQLTHTLTLTHTWSCRGDDLFHHIVNVLGELFAPCDHCCSICHGPRHEDAGLSLFTSPFSANIRWNCELS